MHSAKRIAQNSLIYTSALVIQKILSTVYFWYYSNNLIGGAQALGILQSVISFTTLFFVFGDLGLQLVFLRESSKNPAKANEYLNTFLTLKIPLLFLTILLTIGGGFFYAREDIGLIILALIWLILDSVTTLFYGILRAYQNFIYESVAVIGFQIIVMSIGIASLQVSGKVVYLLIALVIASIVNSICIFSILTFKLKLHLRFAYDKEIAKFIIKNLPGFALTGILVKILNSIDVVLLKSLSHDLQAVGFYSIPLRLINAVSLTVPTALMGALYPAFSHLYQKSEEALHTVFQKALEYLLIISIPIVFGFFSLGDEFISTLWREEYQGAILPAKIMLLSLPFVFLAFPTGNLLNATGRQTKTAISRGFGLITLVLADIILIFSYGIIGAAIALVLSQIVIFIADVYFLRSTFIVIIKKFTLQFLKVLMSSIALITAIEFLYPYIPWYILVGVGSVVYLATLILLKGIDVKFMRHLFVKHV